jgi:hypothetical protein
MSSPLSPRAGAHGALQLLTETDPASEMIRRAVRLEAASDGRSVLLVDTGSRRAGRQREVGYEITPAELIPAIRTPTRTLAATEFHHLAAVPAEAGWFANLDNPSTRRAYQIDLRDFMHFPRIRQLDEFRIVTPAHVLAWRKMLEARVLSAATIRRKLAGLLSLFRVPE